MTIQEAKAKLVNWALAQVGYVETGDNHNKYADKWTAAGGWNAQNQPWCDVFVDVCFIECFGLDLASRLTYQPKGGFSALCSQSAQYYKNNGAYFYSPEVGDQIFFNSGGGINHTGIVTSISGGCVYTVEGNSSDMVRRGVYGLGSSFINGYGRPNWGVFTGGTPVNIGDGSNSSETPNTAQPATQPEKKKTCKAEMELPLLQQGDRDSQGSSWVKIMQLRLLDKGEKLPRWGADGDFGSETLGAVQSFQKKHSLVVDGIVGSATWKVFSE